MGIERDRVESFGHLEDGLRHASPWYWWGPYVSERQWGTVREDYSADGNAWEYLTHDLARSTAYRWGEDGLAGFSDVEQNLCLGLALWNGRDPIIKERLFGVNQSEANHGEDVKEYWWYRDAVPSHAWNQWRYHYPQMPYPYEDLIEVNRSRTKLEPEYELLDTGIFDDDRYWVVDVTYAKADPTDLLIEISVTNAGPARDELHVLPAAWFRNTWSWDHDVVAPFLSTSGPQSMHIAHPWLGALELTASTIDGALPAQLYCDNETNQVRRSGGAPTTRFPKDGINDHVTKGAETVNPALTGTKGSFWYQIGVDPGETKVIRLRLRPTSSSVASSEGDLGDWFSGVIAQRREEADEFYAELTPAQASTDEAMVVRQGFSGMLWSKQLYYYEVARWLEGDPTQPAPPEGRDRGRNASWHNFNSFDIMSMPDKWEYPWFAAWDLAFHCVALARVDPAFAKYQLVLLCREWFQHPSGGLPAYEWDFGDVNPPVQAWAVLEVFFLSGANDFDFLSRVFDKLLVNFTWWVNREDSEGDNLFEGGFLGLDNIGPLDRSHLPVGGILRQADATGWMAFYALSMGSIASVLNRSGTRPATDLVIKFLEHFALVRSALNSSGLWDVGDGFFYDQLVLTNGEERVVAVHSMVGVIPMLATVVLEEDMILKATALGKRCASLFGTSGEYLESDGENVRGAPGERRLLLGVVGVEQVMRLVSRLLSEEEFLSDHGLRSLSAFHREYPYEFDVEGFDSQIDYEPAESTTSMFGGNSNWRGPVWFPLNYLVCDALERYGRFFGDEVTVAFPTGSATEIPLTQVANQLRHRLISLFLRDQSGQRPSFGGVERLNRDPRWCDSLVFSEYFDGDTGAGLGASHQTGWTGLVADLVLRYYGDGASRLAEIGPGPDVSP